MARVSVWVQIGGCTRSGGRAVGVVVLRAAVSTMGFQRVALGLSIGRDIYLYAKPKANGLC